jgi:hypothetical protein
MDDTDYESFEGSNNGILLQIPVVVVVIVVGYSNDTDLTTIDVRYSYYRY